MMANRLVVGRFRKFGFPKGNHKFVGIANGHSTSTDFGIGTDWHGRGVQ